MPFGEKENNFLYGAYFLKNLIRKLGRYRQNTRYRPSFSLFFYPVKQAQSTLRSR